ncbi:MAG: hypothetical protein IPJ65_36360 [Archangiaceae bacterium]|nr:hypothetical protein [Archangiaceae bacterium]
MFAAVTSLLLLAAPAPGLADAGPAPTPRELAQLFFLAGDLRRAVDAGRRCMQLEGRKKCEPFYRALVEYQALIPKNDQLTLAEAKAYLEWDRFVSPQQPGKLTEPVLSRYVEEPLSTARAAWQGGDEKSARKLAERVLEVDPKNADAKALLKQLTR